MIASAPATFKWSRENGSVVFPILRDDEGGWVALENLGRDDRFGLEEGDWVEAENDASVLAGIVSSLLQVQAIDRSSLSVTLSGPLPDNLLATGTHPLLRRWDGKGGEASSGELTLGPDSAALVVEDGTAWLSLEDGVQIQFPPTGATYRTGDYWLIPARTTLGDVEWPRETDANGQPTADNAPLALPPQGVDHFYALLGIVTINADGSVGVSSKLPTFTPLAKS